jgi:hypothetical protein
MRCTKHDGVGGGVDHGFRGEFRIIREEFHVCTAAVKAVLGIDFVLDDKVLALGVDWFLEERRDGLSKD